MSESISLIKPAVDSTMNWVAVFQTEASLFYILKCAVSAAILSGARNVTKEIILISRLCYDECGNCIIKPW